MRQCSRSARLAESAGFRAERPAHYCCHEREHGAPAKKAQDDGLVGRLREQDEEVRTTESITSTAMTAPVNRFMPRPLHHGPSTALSLHSSSRNTVALGSSTPARVWTAFCEETERGAGLRTRPAATTIRPQ